MCTKSLRLFRHKQIDPQMWALVIHPVNVFMLNTTNWIGIRNVLSEQNKCGCGLHGIFRTKKKKQIRNKIYSWISDCFLVLVLTEELLHFFEFLCLTSRCPSQESVWSGSRGGLPLRHYAPHFAVLGWKWQRKAKMASSPIWKLC